MPVSGSHAAPPQSAPPLVPGTSSVPFGPSGLPSRTVACRAVPLVKTDLAVVAEVGIALAGFCVQRDEIGADVGDDARVAAVGPIGDASR